ncbi:MAG: hypothetical protein ABSD31_16455, partial [Candidatus Binataceae bacterium]
IKPVSATRLEIRSTAVHGQTIMLNWDGSGEELANWSWSITVPVIKTKPRQSPLEALKSASSEPEKITKEKLEAILEQYLGMGTGASS